MRISKKENGEIKFVVGPDDEPGFEEDEDEEDEELEREIGELNEQGN